MASGWPIFLLPAVCLVLLAIFQGCESATNADGSGKCGPKDFYCRSNSTCVHRRHRCPSRNGRHWKKAMSLCPQQEYCQAVTTYAPSTSARYGGVMSPLVNPRQNPAIPHFRQRTFGDRFYIMTAYSPIYRTGSRSRRRRGVVEDVWRTLVKDPWMHSFVQYRGLVFEFGTYGIHELDINDPDYKYNREWSTGWSRVGTSSCQYRHLRRFLKVWKEKRNGYSWYSNNCHSFTKALVKYLKGDCVDLAGALSK